MKINPFSILACKGGFLMKKSERLKANSHKNSKPVEKEEISLELTELEHLAPKQEPMTPNHRETAEKDKYY